MKLHNIALALAAGALVTGTAFAQADVTVTHPSRDGGTVTKHISSNPDGSVRKTVRVNHPDGSTTVRRAVRRTNIDGSTTVRRTTRHVSSVTPANRAVVIHRDAPARHVVIREEGRPATIVNRRVTVIRNDG